MKITMYNPINKVKIVTNKEFQPKWEKLGFVAMNNMVLLSVN